MRYFVSLLIAIFVGGLTSVQSAINTKLGELIGSVEATLISFLVGTIAIGILFFSFGRGQLSNIWQTPWYLLVGGLLGAAFVFSMIKIVPMLGTGTTLAGVIAGQLIIAIIIDHFGWLGLNTIKIDAYRISGVIMLLIGVKLITK